jgi:hypothetical protein
MRIDPVLEQTLEANVSSPASPKDEGVPDRREGVIVRGSAHGLLKNR